jgi:hypothetical protein
MLESVWDVKGSSEGVSGFCRHYEISSELLQVEFDLVFSVV